MDVEHLCCLAHAKVKFKYAYNQGCLQARIETDSKVIRHERNLLQRKDGYRGDLSEKE